MEETHNAKLLEDEQYVPVNQVLLVTHKRDVGQNVWLTQTVRMIKLVLIIDAPILAKLEAFVE